MTAKPATRSQTPSVITLDSAATVIAGVRRAAAVQRQSAVRLQAEWSGLTSLDTLVEGWCALARRSLQPNIFYDPRFALAAAPHFGADVGAVLVWTMPPERKLVGMFPARIERLRYGIPLPVLVGWTHPYAPLGTPLVDRDMADAVIAAWLGFLTNNDGMPDVAMLPLIPSEGPLAHALERALVDADLPASDFAPHRRALLAPRDDQAAYAAQAVRRRKRKELQRQLRRLGDTAAVSVETIADPQAIDAALDTFLALEASGWKRRAETAAAQHPPVAAFMRRALHALAAGGQGRIDVLRLGDRPIAAGITLIEDSDAWFWKIAYDEAYARFSPGVQLVQAITGQFSADPTIRRVDSCATAPHPMIDHFWRERLALADRMIGLRPGPYALAQRLEKLRRTAVGAAKSARDFVRRQ